MATNLSFDLSGRFRTIIQILLITATLLGTVLMINDVISINVCVPG